MPNGDSWKEARAAIKDGRWLQFIPPHLLRDYRTQRQIDFDHLAAVGAPLLPLLYVALVLLVGVLERAVLQGRDLWLWLAAEVISGLILLGGVLAVQVRSIRRHFTRWVPVMVALILAAKAVVIMLVQSQSLATCLRFSEQIVLAVGCLALDLSVVEAALAVLPGALLLLMLADFSRFNFWFSSLCFYVVTVVVLLVIRLLHENNYKKYFLQAVLIAQEEKEINRLNERLAMYTSQDVMTGLANRRRFYELLDSEWRQAVETPRLVAVLMVEIDSLHQYRSQHTPPESDSLVLRVAGVLRNAIDRKREVAARYSESQFALLLTDADSLRASTVAAAIIAAVEKLGILQIEAPGAPLVSASTGLAFCLPKAGDDAQVLVDAAKLALKRAQDRGGNQSAVAEANFFEAAFFSGRPAALGGLGIPQLQDDGAGLGG